MARTKLNQATAVVEAQDGRPEGTTAPLGSINVPSKTVRAKSSEMVMAAYAKRSRHVADIVGNLAAAAEVLDPASNEGPMPNAVSRTWQHAVYGYSRVVPELGVAAMYVGNCLSRCNLSIGLRSADGSVGEPITNVEDLPEELAPDLYEAATTAVSKLQAVRGGQVELLRSFGEKDFLCGEAYLVPFDRPDGLRFDCLSVNELMRDGNTYSVYYGPGYATEQLPVTTKPIRIWRPDPQYGRVATSSVRSCIEILEELAILTRLVRANSISRMSLSGILAVAEEFDTPQQNAGADGQISEETAPFFIDMVNTGAKAIDDPASAAAWMPFLLVGPKDLIQNGIKFIPLEKDGSDGIAHRDEALQRLAQGLDLPVEVIMGHQSTTFANAAQVSEDTFKLHIEPALERLCDALTVAYLWPALAAMRGLSPESLINSPYPDDILSVGISYDASKLISHPDRADQIIKAYAEDKSQTAIRISELRLAVGLDADSTPSEEETAIRINALRLASIKETIDAPISDAAVSLKQAAAGGAVTVDSSDVDSATSAASKNPPPAPITASAGATMQDQVLAMKVSATAELTIERALEKIGARLRQRAKGVEAQLVADVDNTRVAAILGPEAANRLLGRDAPAAADLRAFSKKVSEWAVELGYDEPEALAIATQQMVAGVLYDALYANPAAPVRVSAPACMAAFGAVTQ